MKRFIRGMMLAGVAGLVWGCGDDPLAEGAGEGERVVGYPAALFITPGEVKQMDFELLDQNGAAMRTEFTISNVTPGITVDVDETFLPDYDPEGVLGPPDQPSRIRTIVTGGNAAGENSFDVTAGGITETFTVRLTPSALAGTFGGPVVIGVPATLTVAAPAGFDPGATVTSATGAPFEVLEVAPDGTSITFLPLAVEPGAFTIDGVTLDFVPGTTFEFVTEYADGVASPFTNQDDPGATAPPIVFPSAVGDSVVVYDGGQIAAFQFYTLSVGTAGTYEITASWSTAADYDYAICTLGCGGFINTGGATGANPELMTQALAVGDYTLYTNLYDAHDEPAAYWKLIIKRVL